jgi:hypothetical protein
MFANWLQRSRENLTRDVVSSLKTELSDLVESSQGSSGVDDGSVLQLVARVDALEGRFEELRLMCLRHLQSASQRLAKAEQLQEPGDDDPSEQIEMPMPAAEVGNGAAVPESDLDLAYRLVREAGEDPMM